MRGFSVNSAGKKQVRIFSLGTVGGFVLVCFVALISLHASGYTIDLYVVTWYWVHV